MEIFISLQVISMLNSTYSKRGMEIFIEISIFLRIESFILPVQRLDCRITQIGVSFGVKVLISIQPSGSRDSRHRPALGMVNGQCA